MTIVDLLARREGIDFEVKAAQGREGLGEVPRSVWETYSAMANTQGGEIVLGVKEYPDGTLDILGLARPEQVLKSFWDEANNPNTVNLNILRNHDAQIVEDGGRAVVHISVPRASREQRPVYVGPNPLTSTYRRNHEGDYRCPEREVRRMIADAEQDQRDARILPGYTLNDLDASSVVSYRNEFRSANPNHVWLTEDDLGLLTQLGGWRRDRQTDEMGLTLAGVLMFGSLRAILDALPDYVLDYREVPEDTPRLRWADRVTTDGTWSGNLYSFYRRAFARLTDGLRIPFVTEAGRRVDETPVHRALKEALVNALIHADYSASTPILIQKTHGLFSFRNPGSLRIPPGRVRAGGTSDCRNRNLQKMFQMIGAAEQAGSGFPTIVGAWKDQHWRPPSLVERFEPEHITLRLSMASLLPEDVVARLRARFGEAFAELSEVERTAVVTAAVEGKVSNGRLQDLYDLHPAAITEILGRLVAAGFLVSQGTKRWTTYILSPDRTPNLFDTEEETFDTDQSPTESDQTPGDTDQSPTESDQTPGDTDQSEELDLSPYIRAAGSVRSSGWAPPEATRQALWNALVVAQERNEYLSVDNLTVILNRSKPSIYRYLRALREKIETRFVGDRAPGQGYRAQASR
ncbi:MAG: RNA-binding domain-containing protein [Bacteroidota bacterium]